MRRCAGQIQELCTEADAAPLAEEGRLALLPVDTNYWVELSFKEADGKERSSVPDWLKNPTKEDIDAAEDKGWSVLPYDFKVADKAHWEDSVLVWRIWARIDRRTGSTA